MRRSIGAACGLVLMLIVGRRAREVAEPPPDDRRLEEGDVAVQRD